MCVPQTRAEISDLIDEYLASHDLNEASRCLLELGVPAFHHEVVFKAMELAFEKGPKVCVCVSVSVCLVHECLCLFSSFFCVVMGKP